LEIFTSQKQDRLIECLNELDARQPMKYILPKPNNNYPCVPSQRDPKFGVSPASICGRSWGFRKTYHNVRAGNILPIILRKFRA